MRLGASLACCALVLVPVACAADGDSGLIAEGAGGATSSSTSSTTAATSTTSSAAGGMDGAGGGGGQGGEAPPTEWLRLQLDHLRFIGNGDLVGQGDNDYEVTVEVNGTVVLSAAQNDIKTSNGDVVTLEPSTDLMLPRSAMETIEVSFWADDDGSGSNETVMGSRTHTYDEVAEQWTELGSDLTIRDSDGQLDVELQYDLFIVPSAP